MSTIRTMVSVKIILGIRNGEKIIHMISYRTIFHTVSVHFEMFRIVMKKISGLIAV